MHVLIAYDVSTLEPAGQKRLRRVARLCKDWGQRVQNSVFECQLDPAQYAQLKAQLTRAIDPTTDSLRFYLLGKEWHRRVEHVGVDHSHDPGGGLFV